MTPSFELIILCVILYSLLEERLDNFPHCQLKGQTNISVTPLTNYISHLVEHASLFRHMQI
jgi:hypothetical protein